MLFVSRFFFFGTEELLFGAKDKLAVWALQEEIFVKSISSTLAERTKTNRGDRYTVSHFIEHKVVMRNLFFFAIYNPSM
jgi:hypothetical protein